MFTKDKILNFHFTEKLAITKRGLNTRRIKEKKCLSSTIVLFLNHRLKNIEKVSPKNANRNTQKFQVLKHFLCFEKDIFIYPDANFPKKHLTLDILKKNQFKI